MYDNQMEQLKNILRGLGDALVLVQTPRGYTIQTNGAKLDAQNLRNDFAAVGNDLRRTLKHDQQTYQRTRQR